MKYIVFNEGTFTNFDNWSDAEYFMLDKPNAVCKKITSKKVEEEFRQRMKNAKEYKQKIYVIIHDGFVKRFEKWADAKEFIERNPGCKYKSFESEEEAQEFSNRNVHSNKISEEVLTCRVKPKGEIELLKNGVVEEKTTIKNFRNSIEMELNGVLAAIRKAISLGEEQILIEYKNLGTEMWANGTWSANKDYSKAYKDEIEVLRKRINIDFKRV